MLLLLDGLGWSAVEEHREIMPTLAAMEGGPITSVVPSTTAAALTSVATGLAPAQHGIVGYRMLVGRDVLNVLRWTVHNGARPPDPFDVQRHTAFLGREVPVITRSEFRSTGFTQAHLRGGRFIGWHTTATLIEQCVRCVEAGERVVYAYYPGVDTVAHEFGLHDRAYRRELAATDQLVRDLLDALPASAALLVTSDHGQVHLERESWIDIGALAPLVDTMAGDGRFRYLYARKGSARELAERARDLVGRPRLGLDPRRAARTGAAGRRGDRRRSPAGSAMWCSRPASRWPSSTPRCPTNPPCDRATDPSRPTRCWCRCWRHLVACDAPARGVLSGRRITVM